MIDKIITIASILASLFSFVWLVVLALVERSRRQDAERRAAFWKKTADEWESLHSNAAAQRDANLEGWNKTIGHLKALTEKLKSPAARSANKGKPDANPDKAQRA